MRSGTVRYVLEMPVEPDSMLEILWSQQLPQHSVAALLDGRGLVIARTVNPEVRLGRPLAPELHHQVTSADERNDIAPTVEDAQAYYAFTR